MRWSLLCGLLFVFSSQTLFGYMDDDSRGFSCIKWMKPIREGGSDYQYGHDDDYDYE